MMDHKRYVIHAECPTCGCAALANPGAENPHEPPLAEGSQVDVHCPLCGQKHTGEAKEFEE